MNKSIFATLFAASMLAACGGGGGGGGGGTRPDPVTAGDDSGGAPPPAPLGSPGNPIEQGSSSGIGTTSGIAMGMPSSQSVRVTVPGLGIDETFATSDLASTEHGVPVFVHRSGDGTKRTLASYVAGLAGLNLQYSNLGVWDRTDLATGRVTDVGAVSFGNRTPGGDIPTVGTATYNGWLSGVALESGGTYSIFSLANATANFGNRSVALSTSQSLKTDRATNLVASDPGYNLSGTLGYSPGVNALSGTLTTANGKTGAAAGTFYGPSAAELGVTFNLSSGGSQPFVGGAALKR
jgi:hypothetical protein